jgi:hypothetical protein
VSHIDALRSLTFLCLCVVTSAVRAADPCAGFAWDVDHERTLFATEAKALPAGTAVASSPALSVDRLYQLQMSSQSEVTFAAPPGKKMLIDGAHAGLAILTVEKSGVYRISLDQSFWLDVVANGALVGSKDFQGRAGCSAPHKIVEFVLPAGAPLTLQFSGATSQTLRVTVTRSPAQAP